MAIYVGKSTQEKPKLQMDSHKFEVVDFRLRDYPQDSDRLNSKPIYEGIYGINISKIREISNTIKLTKIPNCHECIEGLFELRDEAIPIINLAKYLGYKNTDIGFTDSVIICEFNGFVIGFLVHQATRIRRFSWESIVPPSRLVGKEEGCITGMCKLPKDLDNEDERMLLILDLEKIVAEINGELEILHQFKKDQQNHSSHQTDDNIQTVLVIDDSLTARTQVELLLTQHGYRVLTAGNGEEGLLILNHLYEQAEKKGQKILDILQVIITDVEMPRLDGHGFTQAVKKDPRLAAIPIIIHTSLSGRANQILGRALADDYVVKFNADDLMNSVHKFIHLL